LRAVSCDVEDHVSPDAVADRTGESMLSLVAVRKPGEQPT
jgi:hypothetical protein